MSHISLLCALFSIQTAISNLLISVALAKVHSFSTVFFYTIQLRIIFNLTVECFLSLSEQVVNSFYIVNQTFSGLQLSEIISLHSCVNGTTPWLQIDK